MKTPEEQEIRDSIVKQINEAKNEGLTDPQIFERVIDLAARYRHILYQYERAISGIEANLIRLKGAADVG